MYRDLPTEQIMEAYEDHLNYLHDKEKQLKQKLTEIAEERERVQSQEKRVASIKEQLEEKTKLENTKKEVDNKIANSIKEEVKEKAKEETKDEVKEEKKVIVDKEIEKIIEDIKKRKYEDIMKKIEERKNKAKKVEENKISNVGIDTIVESNKGDKFKIYKEDAEYYYLKRLGGEETYRTKKEKTIFKKK